MTEQELKIFLNDKLWEIGDALMNHFNCCGIDGNSCKASEFNKCCSGPTKFGIGCKFWKDKCTVRDCDCKLWICETAISSTDQKCVAGLYFLERFAKLFGLVTGAMIGQNYIGADKQPDEK